MVEALLNEGIEVTVATRGNTAHVFSKKVNHMVIDRSSLLADKEKLQSEKWDVVFDQICYASRDALDAVEVFNGHTKKYVLTSSKSVYEGKELSREEDFIPEKHSIVMGTVRTLPMRKENAKRRLSFSARGVSSSCCSTTNRDWGT